MATKKEELDNIRLKLRDLEAKKKNEHSELDSLARKESTIRDQIEKKKEELEDLHNQQARFEKQIKNSIQKITELENENEFIKIEKDHFNVANSRFDFKKMNIDKIRERTSTLYSEIEKMKKTINFKVDNMFGKVETQYIELQKKKELTAQNKQKFEDTIVELDDLKNKEIQKTW